MFTTKGQFKMCDSLDLSGVHILNHILFPDWSSGNSLWPHVPIVCAQMHSLDGLFVNCCHHVYMFLANHPMYTKSMY